ncbi:MAG: hypothetical protein CMH49_03600 [Myxococcales bacterium]|nr:hypothetical protein [Myxococcales bacterium]
MMNKLLFLTKSCQSSIVLCLAFSCSFAWAEDPKITQNEALTNSKPTNERQSQTELAEKVAKETVSGPETESEPSPNLDSKSKSVVEAKTHQQPNAVEKSPKAQIQKTKIKPKRKRVRRSRRGFKKGAKKRRRLRKFPTNRPQRDLKNPPTLGKIPFPLGETLTFKVNMLNAHSGTVTLKVGRRGKLQGKSVLELSGFVQSSPVLENFYPIRDSLRVFVDERTFQPLKSEFFLNEKGRKVEYISEFNQGTGRLDWTKTRELKKRKKTSKLSYIAPHPMHETLSSLYALRRLDLKVGMSFEQYIWDGQRERLIEVKVLGEERVLTGIGWIEAFKIAIQGAITGGIISKRALKRPPVKGFAWIAKDAYRTPIKAITPTKLGQAEAVLSAKSVNVGE